MNLLLRMIWMLLTVRWRSTVGVLEKSSLTMSVLPTDLDFNGHVNNGRYLSLADVGRMDLVIRNGAAKIAWRLRAKPIVADAMAKFRKDLKLGQRFTLESQVIAWDDNWIFLEHRFIRQGRVLGIVFVRGLFMNSSGRIKPDTFIENLGADTVSPALPDWAIQWNNSCDKLTQVLRDEESATKD